MKFHVKKSLGWHFSHHQIGKDYFVIRVVQRGKQGTVNNAAENAEIAVCKLATENE